MLSNFTPSRKICLKRLADVCRQEVCCRIQRFIRIAYVTRKGGTLSKVPNIYDSRESVFAWEKSEAN